MKLSPNLWDRGPGQDRMMCFGARALLSPNQMFCAGAGQNDAGWRIQNSGETPERWAWREALGLIAG